ncbi:MAG TPA: hypothetical protein VJU59_23280, partial [Paraburkholderia sp.]|uniref:hypothetical protein n=1 Tax=Paraburkholderia sp. TaxID=1926495 RepID=UPI002B466E70
MDNVQRLQNKTRVFRTLLTEHAPKNADAEALLRWLTPLFDDIKEGKVKPPHYYKFRLALGKDNPFYEPDSPFSDAEAEFIATLEDWESQAWYQEAKKAAASTAAIRGPANRTKCPSRRSPVRITTCIWLCRMKDASHMAVRLR